jgi:hypothetical protein
LKVYSLARFLRAEIDILECAIATAPLNAGLLEQRALAKQKVYKRGATILLREALSTTQGATSEDATKRYVTDPNEIIVEDVNGFQFEFPAGLIHQKNMKLSLQDHFFRIITSFSAILRVMYTTKSLPHSKS